MIDEQSSAVTEFLKNLTTVKKLQENLEQISKRVTNAQQFKDTVLDEGQMVKHFKPKNNSVDAPVHHQTHVAYQTSSLQSRIKRCKHVCESKQFEQTSAGYNVSLVSLVI